MCIMQRKVRKQWDGEEREKRGHICIIGLSKQRQGEKELVEFYVGPGRGERR